MSRAHHASHGHDQGVVVCGSCDQTQTGNNSKIGRVKVMCLFGQVWIGKNANRHENVVMIIKTTIFLPFKLMIFTRFACHHGALYALYVMTDDDLV